ncbi:MAG: DEAD/DEAH box helicase [Acidobacteria bacterium]|nr:DEAD/DEAH box helicase [Acidobacteriota bacterium]MCB9398891.1 DEAD/DEAH box helicase [Acidobacteriota bacterium]
MQFSELGLNDNLLQNLERLGFANPTEIQVAAIPELLKKVDVVFQSHTGSGKTAAFGLPILQSANATIPATQFVVLVPTRELALQVQGELNRMADGIGLQAIAIYGGASMAGQVEALKKTPQIVVGTPGRILDHLKRRSMNFSVVRGIVLDEADKMLSMGFLPEVQLIFRHLPKRRQVVMSSATFPISIERLIQSYMNEPVRIDVSSDRSSAKEIEHFYCITSNQTKDQTLLAFIEKEQPEQSLIFCNTKIEVKAITQYLVGAGISAMSLSSDLSQKARERNLLQLRKGLVNHLVCTDVAARGIDIPNLTHVFIYSTSEDLETYVHRTGRTGRAGRAGKAISLVSGQDVANYTMALKSNDIQAQEITAPSDDEVLQVRINRKLALLEEINFAQDADIPKEFTVLAESLSAANIKSLLPLLLEKFFRPETYDIPEPVEMLDGSEKYDEAPREPREHREHRESRNHRETREPREKRRERKSAPSGSGSSSLKTLCVALGFKDGLNPGDIRFVLTKFGRLRNQEIGKIQMGEYESLVNVSGRSVGSALKANGKSYRNIDLVVAESKTSLPETDAD